MKHKLNYTIWQQVENSVHLFIYSFLHSQNQKVKARLMAFRSRNFHAMYLVAGSFVFA